MSVQPAFQGEVMLAGWSETHNGGAKVTFWLQDEEDLAAFKAMTVAKGKTAGQRLAIVAVEIGPDELPVPPAADAKGDKLARLAAQLCQNPEFWKWASGIAYKIESEEEAAEWIRRACDIESRAQLDHDHVAEQIFHAEIRKPFAAYMEGRK